MGPKTMKQRSELPSHPWVYRTDDDPTMSHLDGSGLLAVPLPRLSSGSGPSGPHAAVVLRQGHDCSGLLAVLLPRLTDGSGLERPHARVVLRQNLAVVLPRLSGGSGLMRPHSTVVLRQYVDEALGSAGSNFYLWIYHTQATTRKVDPWQRLTFP